MINLPDKFYIIRYGDIQYGSYAPNGEFRIVVKLNREDMEDTMEVSEIMRQQGDRFRETMVYNEADGWIGEEKDNPLTVLDSHINHFCTKHGCQMEEREDVKEGGQPEPYFVCILCEQGERTSDA